MYTIAQTILRKLQQCEAVNVDTIIQTPDIPLEAPERQKETNLMLLLTCQRLCHLWVWSIKTTRRFSKQRVSFKTPATLSQMGENPPCDLWKEKEQRRIIRRWQRLFPPQVQKDLCVRVLDKQCLYAHPTVLVL